MSSCYLDFNRNRSKLVIYTHICCLVAKSCPTLCNPMDCSIPGFPALHYFLEFAQTHVHLVDDAIQPSSVAPFSSCPQSSPVSSSFPVDWLLASGGQTIENIYLHYNFLSIFLKIIKINTIQGKYSYPINAGRSTVWVLTCLLSRGGIFHGQSTKL